MNIWFQTSVVIQPTTSHLKYPVLVVGPCPTNLLEAQHKQLSTLSQPTNVTCSDHWQLLLIRSELQRQLEGLFVRPLLEVEDEEESVELESIERSFLRLTGKSWHLRNSNGINWEKCGNELLVIPERAKDTNIHTVSNKYTNNSLIFKSCR